MLCCVTKHVILTSSSQDARPKKEFVMKRMWQNWLAIVTLVAMVGTADAQNSWNQPSEIGSYQSILSRAGYGNAMGSLGQGMMQAGVPMQGSGTRNGAMMSSGSAYGMSGAVGTSVQGGAIPAAPMVTAPAMGHVQDGTVMGGSAMGSTTMGGAAMGSTMVGGSAMGGTAVGGTAMGPVGSGVMGAPMSSGQIMSAPMTSAPMTMSAPVITSAPVLTSQVDMGSTFVSERPLYGNSVGSAAPAYSAPVYTSPVYQQSVVSPVYAAAVGGGRRSRRSRSNYTVGITGLFFQRDYEDNRFLARNPSGDTLFTNDADENTFDGYGVSIASRNAGGGGFEVGYWALNPGSAVGTLTGVNVATSIQGLDQLLHVSSGRDLYDIYANTVTQTIVRDTDINNLEFNLLRNGGTFQSRGGRKGFYELLGGFRWFEFDESLQYTASIDNGAFPLVPSDFFYNLRARNRLLGFQLGARNEYCLGSKLRLFSGVKGGIFNNNIRTVQNITDLDGEIAQVNGGTAAGRPFSYNDEKNDVAFLGELDFGVLYHLSCRARLRLGYRVLGASGVALAADQMPYLYNDPDELLRANSNGSLLLGGGYYGLEFCF